MARANRTRYPILGALTIRPMSGYDIKKFIEGSIANFWRESYGQLYPTLRDLTREGLVDRRSGEGDDGRDRNVYRITAEGRAALRQWIAEPAESEVPRSELLLKLFFGAEVPVETSLHHVAQRRDELEANLALLSAIEHGLRETKRNAPGLPYWLLTIQLGILVDQAMLEWCDEAETVLGKQRTTIA